MLLRTWQNWVSFREKQNSLRSQNLLPVQHIPLLITFSSYLSKFIWFVSHWEFLTASESFSLAMLYLFIEDEAFTTSLLFHFAMCLAYVAFDLHTTKFNKQAQSKGGVDARMKQDYQQFLISLLQRMLHASPYFICFKCVHMKLASASASASQVCCEVA